MTSSPFARVAAALAGIAIAMTAVAGCAAPAPAPPSATAAPTPSATTRPAVPDYATFLADVQAGDVALINVSLSKGTVRVELEAGTSYTVEVPGDGMSIVQDVTNATVAGHPDETPQMLYVR